ncbi:hypothetical protein [Prosthecobacter sp.]|uniref:hypothetical protein n=1 Tax=Prosthecobacter sp. TaxID=1965333 RepID=UPI00378358D4
MINALSFSGRVLHQLRTEVRHHGFTILFWVLWLMLRLWLRHDGVLGRHDEMLTPFVEGITACLGISLIHRCVHADAPANPDTASLTRPIGREAVLTGKFVFLLLGVLLPFVVAESVLWRGFEHGWGQWLALTAGALLAGGFILVLAVVISASSRTRGQALGLGFGVLALVGVMTFGVRSLERHGLPWLKSMYDSAMFMRMNSGIIASVFALILCGAGVWLCFVPRRRGWALMLVLCAFMQEPLTTSMRQHDWFRGCDWLQLPERRYGGELTLHTGLKGPNETAPEQTIWPTLRISGLRDDEAASIIALAPIKPSEPRHLWPSEVFYTDTPLKVGGGDVWANNDHVRVLMRQAPAATLWLQGSYDKNNDRRWIDSDFKQFQLDRRLPQTERWRLRLAIHGVKRIASVPLRELWEKPQTFLLHPGLRLECETITDRFTSGETWMLCGRLHLNRSALIPAGTHQSSGTVTGRPLPPALMLVLEDSELRERRVHDLRLATPSHPSNTPNYDRSYAWQIDTATGFHVQITKPDAQYRLLHKTRADWISRSTASFYELEDRGIVELELSPEQMTQVLAETKEEEDKS